MNRAYNKFSKWCPSLVSQWARSTASILQVSNNPIKIIQIGWTCRPLVGTSTSYPLIRECLVKILTDTSSVIRRSSILLKIIFSHSLDLELFFSRSIISYFVEKRTNFLAIEDISPHIQFFVDTVYGFFSYNDTRRLYQITWTVISKIVSSEKRVLFSNRWSS